MSTPYTNLEAEQAVRLAIVQCLSAHDDGFVDIAHAERVAAFVLDRPTITETVEREAEKVADTYPSLSRSVGEHVAQALLNVDATWPSDGTLAGDDESAQWHAEAALRAVADYLEQTPVPRDNAPSGEPKRSIHFQGAHRDRAAVIALLRGES